MRTNKCLLRLEKPRWVLAIFTVLFLGLISFSASNSLNCSESKRGITQLDSLQILIDSFYEDIAVYNTLVFQQAELSVQIKELLERKKSNEDSIVALNNFDIKSICVKADNKENEKKLKSDLKQLFHALQEMENEKKEIAVELKGAEELLPSLDSKIKGSEKKYLTSKNYISSFSEKLAQPGLLTIKNAIYRFYIVNFETDVVRIHSNSEKNGAQTIPDVINQLKKKNIEAIMVTNGGMYTPSYAPQGLLVEKFKQIKQLDTLLPPKNSNLNFYLQPNGVFYIDSAGFHISTTTNYKRKYEKSDVLPEFATQSGPMLIDNDKRNRNFKSGSTNLNIRNGVGIINSRKAVFIISDSKVNFFEFSMVFQDIFNCKNALYLDGAISQMYIKENIKGAPLTEIDGLFGPIISVTKKGKNK